MEYGKLEKFLDSIQLFRAQVNELHLQQHHICWESIGILAALYHLPVSVTSVKREKGTTRSFQTSEAEERCRNENGKENNLAGGSHSKSCAKPPAKISRRRRKPLVDSQDVNQSFQVGTALRDSVETHDGGNERLVHSEYGSKRGDGGKNCTFLAAEDEEAIKSAGNRGASTLGSHIIVEGEAEELLEAEESLPHLEKLREDSVSIGRGLPEVKTEVAVNVGAPRLTRSRARILQNAGANVTIARGEPPQRKRRERKGKVNPSDSSAAVEKDDIAGKMQTTAAIIALEQQARDEQPSQKPLTGKKRDNRATADGEVGKSVIAAEEQDVEVLNTGNRPTKTTEEEEKNRAEERPSKRSKTSVESTRLNFSSLAEGNASELDKVENAAIAAKRYSGNPSATVLPPSTELDGIVRMSETVCLKDGVLHKEPRTKALKVGNRPTKATGTAEEEEMDSAEGRPSKMKETSLECTRLSFSSLAEGNAFEIDNVKNASRKPYASVEYLYGKAVSTTKRSRGNASATVLPPAEIDGIVEMFETVDMKNGVIGEEQQMKVVKIENRPTDTILTAEEVEQEDRAEERPSKKSRASLGSIRRESEAKICVESRTAESRQQELKMEAQTKVFENEREATAKAFEIAKLDNAPSFEECYHRDTSATSRSRGNDRATSPSPSVETEGTEGIAGKVKTMGLSQNQGMDPTAAAGQLALVMHPWKELNGMELPLANMTTPSSQKGNSGETSLSCGSKMTSNVDLADLNHEKPSEADREVVVDCPDLSSECLACDEEPSLSPLKKDTYRGPRRTTLLLSPAVKIKFVEPEVDIIVLGNPELQDEHTSSIPEVVAEEQKEAQNRPQPPSGKGHSKTFLHLLAKVDGNASRSTKDVAYSVPEHPVVAELVIKESEIDATGAGSVQFPVVCEGSECIAKTKNGMPSSEVNISPRGRDAYVVRLGELQSISGTALQCGESATVTESCILPGQPPQANIERRNSAGTPTRRERRPSELAITTAELNTEELVGDDVCRGEFHSTSGTALHFSDSATVCVSSIFQGQPPQTRVTHRNSAGTPIGGERRLTELVITTSSAELYIEDLGEESDGAKRKERQTLLLTAAGVDEKQLIDVEAGAVAPSSQLKINERKHLLEISAIREGQGGRNSRTFSDVSCQDNRRDRETKVIIPVALDVNPSGVQVGTKETTESLENRQPNLSSVIPSVQVASSNVANVQKPFSNLISGMKSFVPVVQQPTPSFIPDGKRVVKVKALIAAEAAKRAEEEKRDGKDRVRKTVRRADDNPSLGIERKEDSEANLQLKESVEGSKFDGGESSSGTQLSPKKRLLLLSNSRNLCNAESKSKQATNLEIEKKVKKNIADLKKMEEERKRKLLASRQLKEQLVQKKMEERQELLKQKKEQKLVAEQDVQRHQASEESERDRKAMEEKLKSKQCTPRPKEKLQVEELKVRGAEKGVLQTAAARPGQTPGTTHSNLLGPSTLSLRSAVRVPIVSKDKQTATMVAAAIQKKGRHPSSSSSSSKFLSMNAEPTRLPSWNTESARLPSLHADTARLSALNVQCAAKIGPQNSSHAVSLGNRPGLAGVQHGTIGDSVSLSGTPCSRAVDKAEDLGPTSYDISPYRGSSDDESENNTEPAKYIPSWARKENLEPHLLKQLTTDPDEIFSGWKTCSLKEVFGKTGSKKIEDFGKRSGSGDWFRDRVSWKEEFQYKIEMGYVQHTNP